MAGQRLGSSSRRHDLRPQQRTPQAVQLQQGQPHIHRETLPWQSHQETGMSCCQRPGWPQYMASPTLGSCHGCGTRVLPRILLQRHKHLARGYLPQARPPLLLQVHCWEPQKQQQAPRQYHLRPSLGLGTFAPALQLKCTPRNAHHTRRLLLGCRLSVTPCEIFLSIAPNQWEGVCLHEEGHPTMATAAPSPTGSPGRAQDTPQHQKGVGQSCREESHPCQPGTQGGQAQQPCPWAVNRQ